MGNLLILSPADIHRLTASRGSGAINLLTPDPKEAWLDAAVGSAATFEIDLGAPTAIDTVFLGHVSNAAAGASWTVTAGLATSSEMTLQGPASLRVPDVAGRFASLSHALWTGDAATVRYLRVQVTQPAGERALSIGAAMVGKAFIPTWGREWGSGRKVIDYSSVTALTSGGFAVVDGAIKGSYSWTLGDLTSSEVDSLYEIALDHGESRPLLVVEDPAQTAGLLRRVHYCRLTSLRPYERRNPAQTRWDFTIEDWT